MRKGRAPLAAAICAWVLTRLWLVPAALKLGPFHGDGGLDPSVDRVYRSWFAVLSSGAFPAHDVSWQYPPGAALPLLSPALAPRLDYGHAFIIGAALCDAIVFALLLRTAVRRERGTPALTGSRCRAFTGPLAGPWMWTAGLALLSTVPWNRFDLHVTAAAMAALAVAAMASRPAGRAWAHRAFGALTALAALIKVWPVLLLLGTERGRRTRAGWTAAVVGAAVLTAASALAMPHAFSFLTAQSARGIQIESVGSLPFHLARHFGWHGTWAAKDGSHEFVGPYVPQVTVAMQALTVLSLAWLLWWRHRRTVADAPWVLPDAALTATLLFVVTSRVISPQYLIWLVGLAAVCLLRPGTTQRPVARLLLAACLCTTLDFPLLYRELRDDAGWLAIANLSVRNLLLVAAAGLSAVRLWRATAGDGHRNDGPLQDGRSGGPLQDGHRSDRLRPIHPTPPPSGVKV
ncbi:glycosyltransferase family 87 protein [Streptomyces sp. NPDC042319]|uniref:glycosyltransferase family 87 protein n=1 Tax=Streptomyces sp. NPDC042319 TaxID=3154332 RepID=UPI0033CE4035